jgi:hypothetical protein
MSIDVKTVWNRITRVQPNKLSLLTAAEQTKRSWAKEISSHDELPEVYRASFDALIGQTDGFPYTVLTPSYAGFLTRAREKLVCRQDGKIVVLEQVRGDIITTYYPIETISYVEVGDVLLQSWVKIRGQTGDGVLTTSEFKFNTVTDHLFTPIVETVRPAAASSAAINEEGQRSRFNHLRELNLKLMNYAKRSVMPGSEILHFVLQPEIRGEVLRLLGHSFFRTRCTPHLSILTDRELILIQDGASKRPGRGIRYGGVWHYIPLDKITSISAAGTEKDLLTMSIHLAGDDRIESLFSVSNRGEIDILIGQFAAISEK